MSQPSKIFPDHYEFGRTEFTFNVKNVKNLTSKGVKSSAHSTGDVEWRLNVCSTDVPSGRALSAFLYCDAVDVANWWKVKADFRIVLENKSNSKLSIARQMEFLFECEDSENHGWNEFVLHDDLLDEDVGFVDKDDCVTFRVMVGISSVDGFYTPKYFNFWVPSKDFSDKTIKVRGRTFHVNQMILSVHSDVFAKAFNHQKADLEFDDLDPAEFNDFLQLLYAVPIRICGNNVGYILGLAIRFETNGLKQSCVQYLDYAIRASDMDICELAKVAHKYELTDTMKNAVNSVKTVQEMKAKFSDIDNLPQEIVKEVVTKSLALS